MKPEVNAVLAEVKAQMNSMDNASPQPTMPDFKTLSIMEATKWCIEHGITKAPDIANTTGKQVNTIHTAMWKLRNPKRVKVLARRAKKVRDLKAGVIKEGVKATKVAKPTKVKKPIIEEGRYEDGMDTPWRDAIQRRGVFPSDFVEPKTLDQWIAEKKDGVHYLKGEVDRLRKEVQRLTIIVEYYEGKAGK